MRNWKNWIAMVSLAATTGFVGCVPSGETEPAIEHDSLDQVEEASFNLEDEYGGLDTEDETDLADALGADFEDGDAVEEEMELTPEVEEEMARADARVYLVRVLWGQLRGNPNVEEATDWSGTVGVDAGAVQILRTIRFEGRDGIVRPRTTHKGFEFTSRTLPHNDGLLLRVVNVAPEGSGNQLTIDLGGETLIYEIDDLDDLVDVRIADDMGNKIVVQALQAGGESCPRGFLGGKFRKTRENGGRFGGRWISETGQTKGYLFGVYGTRQNGERVMFGKYVAANGRFLGLLKGTWNPSDEPGSGTFAARWVDKDRDDKGILHGGYQTGERAGMGFFRGRWAHMGCLHEEPTEPSDEL